MWLYLSEGEAHAAIHRHGTLLRHRASGEVITGLLPGRALAWHNAPAQAVTLAAALESHAGVDELIHRLDKRVVAPYSAADWLALQAKFGDALTTVWSDMNSNPCSVALASAEGSVYLPCAWGTGPDDTLGFGPFGQNLAVDPSGAFAVFGADHRFRFVRLGSAWQSNSGAAPLAQAQPCDEQTYAYLDTSDSHLGLYQASVQALQPDADGDWLCDLINADGQVNQPSGCRVLAGSAAQDGCMVKSTALGPRCVAWWPFGVADPKPHLLWAALQGCSEGRRPAQDLQTGLWGWADAKGLPLIETHFAQVGHFQHGLAAASLSGAPDVWGLVNHAGEWLEPPRWAQVSWSGAQRITVQNPEGQWGAIGFSLNEQGAPTGESHMVFGLQAEQVWVQAYLQHRAAQAAQRGEPDDERCQIREPWCVLG